MWVMDASSAVAEQLLPLSAEIHALSPCDRTWLVGGRDGGKILRLPNSRTGASVSSMGNYRCRAMELFFQQEGKGGALALAAALAAGVSLSLAHPAMAECDHRFTQQPECPIKDVRVTWSSRDALRLGIAVEQARVSEGPVLASSNDGDPGSRIQLRNSPLKLGKDTQRSNSVVTSAEVWGGSTQEPSQGMQRRSTTLTMLSTSAADRHSSSSGIVTVGPRSVSFSGDVGPHQMLSMPGASQLITRLLQHLGGGGFAGAVGATVVYPLDTIKTRLQAQSKDGKYKDVLDCCRKLLLEEGLGSLYSGLVPQLLGIAPEKALKLTVNEVILGCLEQHLPGARIWALEIIAGGGGGFSQVLVTNPMEIVKLRLQIQSNGVSPKGLWEMVRELGLGGLYSGSGITLARDVPSSAIFFACYAVFMQMYPGQMFWAGFLAAIPATLFVTPLDVIKTRLQMETPPGEEPYKDVFHCFRVVLQQEGIRGLFKGGLLRVLRTSPQFGITLLMYSFFGDGC